MKWRPKATRSASPKVTMASAEAGVKPPAAIKVRENFGRRCCAAIGARPCETDFFSPLDAWLDHVEVDDAQKVKLSRYIT